MKESTKLFLWGVALMSIAIKWIVFDFQLIETHIGFAVLTVIIILLGGTSLWVATIKLDSNE